MKELFKKSISFALSFLMIASFVPAEALEVGSRDEADVVVTVGDATISEMGTTVDVPVSIEFKNASAKVDAFGLQFDFDSDNFVMHESTGRRDPVITVGDDTLCTSVTGSVANKRATYADDSGFGLDQALVEELETDILFYLRLDAVEGYENGTYTIDVDIINNAAGNFAYQSQGVDVYFVPGTITMTGGAEAHVHAYENPTYTWAADNSTCTAEAACACEETDTQTVTATKSTVPAECGKNSVTTYTATFTKSWATTQTKEVEGADALSHKYTNYVSNGDATCTADGTKTAVCDNGCGTEDTVADTGSAKGHKYTNYVSNGDATCEADGTKTAVCDNGCGTEDTVADAGSKLGHVDADHNHKCDNNCGKEDMGTHADSNTDADHVCDYGCGEVMEDCSDKTGDNDHKCDVCGEDGVTEHTYGEAKCDEAATCTECHQTTGTAIGHTFTDYVYNNDATCEADGTETAECVRHCGETDTRVKVGSKLGHAWGEGVVTTPATCENPGEKTYTCANDAAHTKKEPIEATGHKWNAGVVTTPATCEVPGVKTYTCENNAAHTKTEPINATGHKWNAGVETTPATCTVDGVKTFTCENNAAHTKTEPIRAKGHTWDAGVETKPASCTENGVMTFHCTVCEDGVKTQLIDVLDHEYGSDGKCKNCGAINPSYGADSTVPSFEINTDKVENGTVELDKDEAKIGEMVTVTVTPDKGYKLEELIVKDRKGNEIKVKKNADGTFTFKMPVGNVEIEPVFVGATAAGQNPFVDVKAGDYFYNPVLWAANSGITNGMSATEFAPGVVCNRAQVVTFLWRAAGSPAPKSSEMPFTDVAEGSYYYNAVLWAVENGITNGMTETEFAPNATVTRGQTVTFLWRAAKGSVAEGETSFLDVHADAYYYSAVQWAVKNGITNGMSATEFAPNAGCTRGQIVTFLYRSFMN